jgi:hypothetical protein
MRVVRSVWCEKTITYSPWFSASVISPSSHWNCGSSIEPSAQISSAPHSSVIVSSTMKRIPGRGWNE